MRPPINDQVRFTLLGWDRYCVVASGAGGAPVYGYHNPPPDIDRAGLDEYAGLTRSQKYRRLRMWRDKKGAYAVAVAAEGSPSAVEEENEEAVDESSNNSNSEDDVEGGGDQDPPPLEAPTIELDEDGEGEDPPVLPPLREVDPNAAADPNVQDVGAEAILPVEDDASEEDARKVRAKSKTNAGRIGTKKAAKNILRRLSSSPSNNDGDGNGTKAKKPSARGGLFKEKKKATERSAEITNPADAAGLMDSDSDETVGVGGGGGGGGLFAEEEPARRSVNGGVPVTIPKAGANTIGANAGLIHTEEDRPRDFDERTQASSTKLLTENDHVDDRLLTAAPTVGVLCTQAQARLRTATPTTGVVDNQDRPRDREGTSLSDDAVHVGTQGPPTPRVNTERMQVPRPNHQDNNAGADDAGPACTQVPPPRANIQDEDRQVVGAGLRASLYYTPRTSTPATASGRSAGIEEPHVLTVHKTAGEVVGELNRTMQDQMQKNRDLYDRHAGEDRKLTYKMLEVEGEKHKAEGKKADVALATIKAEASSRKEQQLRAVASSDVGVGRAANSPLAETGRALFAPDDGEGTKKADDSTEKKPTNKGTEKTTIEDKVADSTDEERTVNSNGKGAKSKGVSSDGFLEATFKNSVLLLKTTVVIVAWMAVVALVGIIVYFVWMIYQSS